MELGFHVKIWRLFGKHRKKIPNDIEIVEEAIRNDNPFSE